LVNSTGTGTLGRLAQVDASPLVAVVDSHITVIRPKKGSFDDDFFGWLLRGAEEEIASKGEGASGQTELSRSALSNVIISFPESIKEQNRVVNILGNAFQKLDRAKSDIEMNLRNTREIFDVCVQNYFVHRGENWEIKSLGEIATIEYGYTEKARSSGEYRFVRITDTDENGLLKTENKMYVNSFETVERFLLNSGDLLMARTGASAGNVLFFEGDERAVFASYLIRIKFKGEILAKLYWYFSRSKLYWDQVEQLSAGSAQPQFNGGALKQIMFPYPQPLAEQLVIIDRLDTLSILTRKLETLYQQKLALLEELKQSILHKAFSGEL